MMRGMLVAMALRPPGLPRSPSALLRLAALLLVLLYGWMAYSNSVSDSHDPLVGYGHGGASGWSSADDHGHGHDGAEADGHDRDGHQHGHDAADHSHDKPNLSRGSALAVWKGEQVWTPAERLPVPPGPYFPFERPPKAVPIS